MKNLQTLLAEILEDVCKKKDNNIYSKRESSLCNVEVDKLVKKQKKVQSNKDESSN